jgi:molybdate transport system substrate-binding protein
VKATLTLILSALFTLAAARPASADAITVAAAISLKEALVDIAQSYKTDTGESVQFTFASSGQLMAQVKNGAPIDLFISAAARQVDDLAKANAIDDNTRRIIAGNDLVLIVPANAKSPPTSFKDLADPKHRRIALGEPRTVPAGEYAAQALAALKLTDAIKSRTVYANNVRQVLDYVERGEVAAGLVYATDAKAAGDKVRIIDRAPPDTHTPITYPAAVVSASKQKDAAQKFLTYLTSARAQKLLATHGFTEPPAIPPAPPESPIHHSAFIIQHSSQHSPRPR